MVPYRKDAIQSVIGRSSFGVWDLLNKGADPFGAPVRPTWDAVDAIKLLGKLNVPHVSLHDIDVGLDPWVTTEANAFDARLKELQNCLKAAGVKVWMYTPCLFHNPLVRAGSVTANDVRVRRASLRKMFTAFDVANQFDASYVTFWFGRDGSEVDALIDAKAAYQRTAEAVHLCCEYVRNSGYNIRITMEPKPNEPRGDIYVSTVGTALGIIGMLPNEDQQMVGVNPELLQHESMAGLNSYHAIGQLIAAGKLAFLHLGGQTPLRYDMDHPFLGGNSDMKQSFYIALAVAKHAPDCVLEFDCHPFRTEAYADAREEFVLANLEAFGLMLQKAQSFLQIDEVKKLLTDTDSTGFGLPMANFSEFIKQLRAEQIDAVKLAEEINPQAQYLDRLVNLHLLGVV